MTTPKHRTAPGASYFVTTKCSQGRTIFQVPEVAEILVKSLFHYRDCGICSLHEFVVMPDHLHLLLTPSLSASLEKALQMIKGGSSHEIRKEREHKMEIWQAGFYDWTIRDAKDWLAKADYIRLNPVRARLTGKPEDWPYSSAIGHFSLDPAPSRYVRMPSGAEAPSSHPATPELKLRPPEERRHA
jgi:putative transposase